MSSPELSKPGSWTEGDTVRCKAGSVHPLIQEVPLGGWAGFVSEIGTCEELGLDYPSDPETLYAIVEWDDATLDPVSDVFRQMCERDDHDPYTAAIPLADLEADTEPRPMPEPIPSEVVERFQARDDRIRQALGVPEGVEIPRFSEEFHDQYHAYLAEHLVFPFEAEWEDLHDFYEGPLVDDLDAAEPAEEEHVHGPDCDHSHDLDDDYEPTRYDVTVTGLVPAAEYDPAMGVMCTCLEQNRPVEADLEQLQAKHHPANQKLIDDYAYWFNAFQEADWSDGGYHPEDDYDADDQPPGKRDPLFRAAYQFIEQRLAAGGGESVEELMEEFHSAMSVQPPRQEHGNVPYEIPEPIRRDHEKVGRNDPCPCGSGKKFKKCCLKSTT